MASNDSVSKIESEISWQHEELQMQQQNERNARTSLKRALENEQSSWDRDIDGAISRQNECMKKLESYDRELTSERRVTPPNTSKISHIEGEMRWQREELTIQQQKERNARESLKRALDKLQYDWDVDIRKAIAKQEDCNKKIESLGRELITARNQAMQDKAAEDKRAAEAAAAAAAKKAA